jgi:hypothetical protein
MKENYRKLHIKYTTYLDIPHVTSTFHWVIQCIATPPTPPTIPPPVPSPLGERRKSLIQEGTNLSPFANQYFLTAKLILLKFN